MKNKFNFETNAAGAPVCDRLSMTKHTQSRLQAGAPRVTRFFLTILFSALALAGALAQEIQISREGDRFGQKPIPISISGFTGEGAEVLKFDLYKNLRRLKL